jgi:hypothetical protein
VTGLCALKALVHLALINRYGYHGDELYFIECGRHLSFGYVDQPPLVPWLARLGDVFGAGFLALRLPALFAGTGTLALTGLLVREWGGGYRAQLLALLCLLIAPAQLRMGAQLGIPVIEVFLCTLTAYLVSRALARQERSTWLLAGGALGLAALAKYSSIVWGAALFLGVLVSPSRRVLASCWPWLGAAVATLLLLPNLLWQVEHGFVSFQFMSALRESLVQHQGRAVFVSFQLIYFHPLSIPVWFAGLAFAFRDSGKLVRPFALLFLCMFGFFVVTCGKPYYLASAYPGMLAAGGVALERALAHRVAAWRASVGALAVGGAVAALLALPILPLQTVDALAEALLGRWVSPTRLTMDMHGMYGWEQLAATVDQVYRSLPAADRTRASVLAGSYSQAAALNLLRPEPLPRAVSGHVNYYLWGPDPHRGEVLMAVGVPLQILQRMYARCQEQTRIDAPLARPFEANLPVYVCRNPSGTLAEHWPELQRFGAVFSGQRWETPAPAVQPGNRS